MENNINRIALIDPFVRLKILKEYIAKWVDEYPYKYSFGEYIRKKYPYVIPGTVDYYKEIATHCFYCNAKLVKGRNDHESPKRSSVDHYLPQSKGKTERFVICCAECNTKKGSTSPDRLVSQMTVASLKGSTVWGYHGKKLKFIADQIQQITNDMLYNMGPKIYYFKR